MKMHVGKKKKPPHPFAPRPRDVQGAGLETGLTSVCTWQLRGQEAAADQETLPRPRPRAESGSFLSARHLKSSAILDDFFSSCWLVLRLFSF